MQPEFWNQRYAEEAYAYGTHPNAYFKSVLDSLPPGRLLVPGAGEGRDAVFAAACGWQVLAFDQSEEGRRKALQLASQQGVVIAFDVSDAADYAPIGSFDAIALIFFHLPSPLRASFHQRVVEWLRPGGHLILEAFTPQQLQYKSGGPRDAALLMTPNMLQQDFTGLDIVENTELITQLEEGDYHRGPAAVVRFHGIKPAGNS